MTPWRLRRSCGFWLENSTIDGQIRLPLACSCFKTGVAVKGGTIMAHSVSNKSGRIGRSLKSRVGAVASYSRILGVLTILGLLTMANLRAQDRAQPSDGPRTSPSPPAAPVPAPQAPRVERAPELVQAAELRLAETRLILSNNAGRRFQFTIDPKTPLKDLLPVPPQSKNPDNPVIAKDLTQVPEVQFQMPFDRKLPSPEGQKQTAHTIAKINHLNEKKTDGFLEDLRHERLDLTGLPFAMGDACRTKGERSKQFAVEVNMVRSALQQPVGQINTVFSVDNS